MSLQQLLEDINDKNDRMNSVEDHELNMIMCDNSIKKRITMLNY